jgi:uncharacterized protein YjiS (DUF1127 family)
MLFFLTIHVKNTSLELHAAPHQLVFTRGRSASVTNGVPELNPYLSSQSLSAPDSSQPGRPFVRLVRAVDSAFGAAMNTLFIWDRRHRDRLHLTSLDERMLRDIGITSADVEHEAAKPFWRG